MAEAAVQDVLDIHDLRETWALLSPSDRREGFALLSREQKETFFLELPPREQLRLLFSLPQGERRGFVRLLPPDDCAELIRTASDKDRPGLLDLLDAPTRREVSALLAYAEDEAGGLMNPRFARVRPEMTVDAAIT